MTFIIFVRNRSDDWLLKFELWILAIGTQALVTNRIHLEERQSCRGRGTGPSLLSMIHPVPLNPAGAWTAKAVSSVSFVPFPVVLDFAEWPCLVWPDCAFVITGC